VRLWPARKPASHRDGQRRLLLPFTASQLDPEVLDAVLRIARADDAVVVPAYLLVVPLEFSLDAPVQHDELKRAMPILEAVELAARRAGVPVDARIERGRAPIDGIRRLWEEESFDLIFVPAPAPGHPGFSPKDLAWMLTNAPSEMLILRPAPELSGAHAGGAPPWPLESKAEGTIR
jgi:nucleotide-binding universal stress UspA family protein